MGSKPVTPWLSKTKLPNLMLQSTHHYDKTITLHLGLIILDFSVNNTNLRLWNKTVVINLVYSLYKYCSVLMRGELYSLLYHSVIGSWDQPLLSNEEKVYGWPITWEHLQGSNHWLQVCCANHLAMQ